MAESSKPVYLVGTRHRFQGWRKILCFTPKHQLDEFKTFLQKTIHDHGIRSVAEEMNIEALTTYSRPDMPPSKSIPCLAAEELDLPHKYCDPDSAKRHELNITNDDNDEDRKKREAEWLAQLVHFASFPCLFVLGSEHTSSFSDLLKASGFKPILLEQEWWPSSCK
jgi:hypothetical protein